MNDPHLAPILADSHDARLCSPAWFSGDTHTGQVRANNEDRFFCDEKRGLFIVADGMGGHAAGEEASRIVVDVLCHALCADVLNDVELREHLVEALRQSNNEVIRQSEANYQWRGMGSTAVIGVVQNATLYLAHVGDSRAYVLRAGRLHQMSQDHSVAATLARQNQIRQEEVRTHALRNRLTMCLGIEAEIEPETLRLDLEPEDRVLLCSDGLWDMLADEEIGQLLQLYPAPGEAVKALLQAANDAGGKDNITAIVVHPQLPASPDSSEDTVILRTHVDG